MPQSYAPEFKRRLSASTQRKDEPTKAGITDRHITSDLAIRTLKKALESQPVLKGELILHSDQGSQFTSKAFVEFCESVHVTQSMSKAGYPDDNAPMDCLITPYQEVFVYVKDKAAQGGVKHPLHTRETPVISKQQSNEFFSHKCYKNA